MNAGLEFWLFEYLIAIFVIVLMSALLFPLMRIGLGSIRPALRANILLGWCAAPILLGAAFAFAPLLFGVLELTPSGCGRVSDAILRTYGPDGTLGQILPTTLDSVLMAPFAWFAFSGARRIRDAVKLHSGLGALIAAGRKCDAGEVIVIDHEEPLAFVSGWYRSRIVMTSSLKRRLSKTQMDVVLAHEQAHVRRCDTLRYLLAEIMSVVHLPGIRSMILMDMQLATEQACDEAAVQVNGDRFDVAETLLRVERLFGRPFRGALVPIHLLGGELEARVEALVGTRSNPSERWQRIILVAAILSGMAVIAGAVPLHEFMGSFLV